MVIRRVTIQDIADKVGVNKSTVSRALSGSPQVSEEMRARIIQSAKEMNYVPNEVARSLYRGTTNSVGLLVLDIMNPFFAEFARGAENYLLNHGYSLVLCNSDGKLERERLQLNLLREMRVSGLILTVLNPNASHFNELVNERYPMIMLDKYEGSEEVSYVTVDGVVGGRMATEYLLKIGHRRIGHIAGPQRMSAHEYRSKGYLEALMAYEVPADPDLIIDTDESTSDEGYRVMKKFLQMPKDKQPTAIFAFNDIVAMGAYRAIIEAGYEVPRDYSLIGYDNIELASLLSVPLTTIEQPTYDQGKLAAMMLLEIMENPKHAKAKAVVLQPKLVIRETTAPYRGT